MTKAIAGITLGNRREEQVVQLYEPTREHGEIRACGLPLSNNLARLIAVCFHPTPMHGSCEDTRSVHLCYEISRASVIRNSSSSYRGRLMAKTPIRETLRSVGLQPE